MLYKLGFEISVRFNQLESIWIVSWERSSSEKQSQRKIKKQQHLAYLGNWKESRVAGFWGAEEVVLAVVLVALPIIRFGRSLKNVLFVL